MNYSTRISISSTVLQPIHGVTTTQAGTLTTTCERRDILMNKVQMSANTDVAFVHQVHGTVISSSKEVRYEQMPTMDADGLIAQKGKRPICVYVTVADCLPLLLWDPVQSVIGAVHSGWKGTMGNISNVALDAMEKFGSNPHDIRAFIGPHIRACCYSVSSRRAQLFPSTFVQIRRGLDFLDLGSMCKNQLLDGGLNSNNIELSLHCTSCDHRFFSYRREKRAPRGTMIAYIQS